MLALSPELGDGLLGELTTTPLEHLLLVELKEVSVDAVDDLLEVLLVLSLDITKSDAGGGLEADDLTEAGLALDNAVWDVELPAESWEPNDDFEWVDIVGDDDEAGLLGLDKGGDILDTVGKGLATSEGGWGEGLLRSLGSGLEAGLLLGLGLWAVLLKELEDLDSSGLVKGLVEVVHWWWDLKALAEDLALALKADILWEDNLGSGFSNWSGGLVGEEVIALLDITIEDDSLLSGCATSWHSYKGRPQTVQPFLYNHGKTY